MALNDLKMDSLVNPLIIQSEVLNEFQNRLTGGEAVADSNNVFSFLVESFASITADAVREVERQFESLYPMRARTSEDLYKHMSDFDYVNMFSTPSSFMLTLTLDKNYIVEHAVSYNNDYQRIVIPKDTVFRIANYYFGIHYPIDIRINKRVQTIMAAHDTSNNNPLQVLQQNTIEHREFVQAGLKLVAFNIPVFQFERTTIFEDITDLVGFVKVYDYNDRFYALRIYNEVDGEWVEIHQTVADEIYDPTRPTAKLTVEQELNRMRVTIPQTYFTSGMMGRRLKLEIHTTLGDVNIDVSEIPEAAINANFKEEEGTSLGVYTTIFNRLPTLHLIPTNLRIVGGSNGYGFAELRERVINDTFHGSTLITPHDLEKYFQDIGFTAFRYRDGITDRIYYVSKYLTDAMQTVIASANAPLEITVDELETSEHVRVNNDGSYTILPSAIYKYDDVRNITTMLTDDEINELNTLGKPQLVQAYNSERYTITPFHVRIDPVSRHPMAYAYDLSDPEITRMEFIGENVNVSTQLTIYHTEIYARAHGFDVEILVARSADLEGVLVEEGGVRNFHVLTKLLAGTVVAWNEASYVDTIEQFDRYRIAINTNYSLSVNNTLRVSSFYDYNHQSGHEIPLETLLEVTLLCHNTLITEGGSTSIGSGIPVAYTDYVPLAQQNINIKMGRLVDELFARTNIFYTNQVYATWPTTKYATYSTDIYITDDNQIPRYVQTSDTITRTNAAIVVANYAGLDALAPTDNEGWVTDASADLTPPLFHTFTDLDEGTSALYYRTDGDWERQFNAPSKIALTDWLGARTVVLAINHLQGELYTTPKFHVTDSVYADGAYILERPLTAFSAAGNIWTREDGMVTASVMDYLKMAIEACDIVDTLNDIDTVTSTFVYVNDAETDYLDPLYISGAGTGGALYHVTDTGRTKLVEANTIVELLDWHSTQTDRHGYVYVFEVLSTDHEVVMFHLLTTAINPSWAHVDNWPWERQSWQLMDRTFDSPTMTIDLEYRQFLEYIGGEVRLDATGAPVVSDDRKIVYNVDMVHLDAKLVKSERPEHRNYLGEIRDLLRSYLQAVRNARPQLIENTRLYYKPLRTMGTAQIKLNQDTTIRSSLELEVRLRIHVLPYVVGDNKLITHLRNGILQIIDEHVSTGIITCTAITEDIRREMSDTIKFVDVLGINGNTELQTMVTIDQDTRPHLKTILKIGTDGRIDVERALTLDVVSI